MKKSQVSAASFWTLASLAAGCLCTPAEATVAFENAFVDSQTRIYMEGSPPGILSYSGDASRDFATRPSVASLVDSRQSSYPTDLHAWGRSAEIFASPWQADFYMLTSILGDKPGGQRAIYALSSSTARYEFTVDADSTLSFVYDVSTTQSSSDAVEWNVLDRDTLQSSAGGDLLGSGSQAYSLPKGRYLFTLDLRSEESKPPELQFGTDEVIASADASLSLSITSAVPEAAPKEMMLLGLGVVALLASRRRGLRQALAK